MWMPETENKSLRKMCVWPIPEDIGQRGNRKASAPFPSNSRGQSRLLELLALLSESLVLDRVVGVGSR